jgi:hypothetical protein
MGDDMQVMEYAKKAGFFSKKYALSVVSAPKSQDEFMQEFRHVKEALVAWERKRGRSRESVMFVFTSDVQNHQWIRDLMENIYQNEATLSPMLKALNVTVALLNPSGTPAAEYTLGQPR